MKTLSDYTPGRMQRTKIYGEASVLDAAIRRLERLFMDFDNVCFAVSGGKDSGLAVQLGNEVASRL
nr:hypothetical protein [Candidatus Sigynarchaeota archaeon]